MPINKIHHHCPHQHHHQYYATAILLAKNTVSFSLEIEN
jgi:hypothetical protein